MRSRNLASEFDILAYRITRLEADLEKAEREIEELRDGAADRERNHLKAGVIILGSLIMTLFGVIWANLGVIFPGR